MELVVMVFLPTDNLSHWIPIQHMVHCAHTDEPVAHLPRFVLTATVLVNAWAHRLVSIYFQLVNILF
jgi:hypothetical protein